MLKKLFAVLSITCIVVGSISSVSNADYTYYGSGLQHKYNGSYYYDQAWAKIRTLNEKDAVDVWVIKNTQEKGRKTTYVNSCTLTCYSYQVTGNDATGSNYSVRKV